MTVETMQSSAYVPEWEHFSLCHLSSFARRRAKRYLEPSFSSSAIVHSVTMGTHLASNRSIKPVKISILTRAVCEKKFVSRITWYGGPRAWFASKKSADGACGMCRTALVSSTFREDCFFACSRWSRWPRIRFTCDMLA